MPSIRVVNIDMVIGMDNLHSLNAKSRLSGTITNNESFWSSTSFLSIWVTGCWKTFLLTVPLAMGASCKCFLDYMHGIIGSFPCCQTITMQLLILIINIPLFPFFSSVPCCFDFLNLLIIPARPGAQEKHMALTVCDNSIVLFRFLLQRWYTHSLGCTFNTVFMSA